jgi:cytochrome c-type biogenesis protein CcmH
LTTFMLACAGLVIFSALFYLFPARRLGTTEDDLDRENLAWFRRRQVEVREEGNAELDDDVSLRFLEDEHRHSDSHAASNQSFPVWVLLPLVALAATALYHHLGAASDVTIASQLRTMHEGLPPEQMRQLIQAVEKRSSQRPDNLHYQALLGRYYVSREDYARAREIYGLLVQAVPEDDQILAYAAQAEYLAEGRVLTQRARLRAEQALAVNPHQATALGLLGMASFELQKYAAAIEYWQRLLATESPNSENAKMILQVVETARQRLAISGADVGDTATVSSTAVSAIGVTVRVTAPAGANIGAGDTVFILARGAESGSRMPIAVQRLTGAQMPITLRLNDGNSMAGQKLSQASSVIVAVQVSPGGQPGEANASWLGQADGVVPSDSEEPVDIQLRANTPQGQ